MAKAIRTLTYRWPDTGLIRRIDVREQPDGRAVAYLYADESADKNDARRNLRATLREHGLGTLSDYREGAYALRISGLRNGTELLTLLQERQVIQDIPAPTQQAAAQDKPKSFSDQIRAHSLQASGIVYSIGNAIYLINGLLRNQELKERGGKPKTGQIGSALVWGAGDVMVATLGKRDDSRQLASLLGKLDEHYRADGIAVPSNAALRVETSQRDQSAGARVFDFLHDHVNQIKCASEVLAAVQYYKAGQEQGNVWKQRTAVTFGLGFLASLVIPEKKIDPEKYAEAGGLERLWMKIQSNPLSVGGISGYSNTIFTSIGAVKEHRNYRDFKANPGAYRGMAADKLPSRHYGWDYAAPSVMFFGNTLYAMSKKSGGDIRSDSMVGDVYIVAAQILNKQPENAREAAIASTIDFLAQRPEISDSRPDIEARLKQQMEIQRKSPWFEDTPLPTYLPRTKPKAPRTARDEIPATQIEADSVSQDTRLALAESAQQRTA